MNNRPWWHSGAACVSAAMWTLFMACTLLCVLGIGSPFIGGIVGGGSLTLALLAGLLAWGEGRYA